MWRRCPEILRYFYVVKISGVIYGTNKDMENKRQTETAQKEAQNHIDPRRIVAVVPTEPSLQDVDWS